MNKNVLLLATCQGLITTGNILLVTIAALVGQALSPSAGFTTFPVATQMIGLLLTTIPASLIMAKVGRKVGFSFGNLIGISGTLLGFWSLTASDFWLFSLATFLIGIGIGFATLYRFAAIEASDNPATAIATVMASGVVAAILGPNIAVWVNAHFASINYANVFIALSALYCVALCLLQLVTFNEINHTIKQLTPRPLKQIIAQPKFITAVLVAMTSYTTMNLLMTATPLAMHRHGFDLSASALVIEWHVLGMFVPSFFTGKLIARFGQSTVMASGALVVLGCCVVNLLGVTHWHFLLALSLLGIGWNFMFIAATHMVSETYQDHERGKAQASNEFLVFSMVAISSLAAGWLESEIGWQALNIAAMPMMICTLLIVAIYQFTQKRLEISI
ncbi:Riboflavin transporter RfnT [Pseudoalteromonas sp. CIP111854]|uniref:Riboflavin transporter RfnT n=1 Tax=Pseudoalteromonas holothuriae TaxID=2963714 RepID=A0A9W4QRQ3_9GAMM|nr:MFS transporter [Pseudoalteromonas sp. CIP111854]CAH9049862.1 Riboflavin transporter RfnT [Pseudoalteromonas sp. CIP111854]